MRGIGKDSRDFVKRTEGVVLGEEMRGRSKEEWEDAARLTARVRSLGE